MQLLKDIIKKFKQTPKTYYIMHNKNEDLDKSLLNKQPEQPEIELQKPRPDAIAKSKDSPSKSKDNNGIKNN